VSQLKNSDVRQFLTNLHISMCSLSYTYRKIPPAACERFSFRMRLAFGIIEEME